MQKPLFIFEMANNHNGEVSYAREIVELYSRFIDDFPQFDFAFKFQYRDLDTFIHRGFVNNSQIKYIPRFINTNLSKSDRLEIRNQATNYGFKTICTPFDEPSVDLIEEHKYDMIKIASCSLTDWPLLERIAKTNLPIIASVAGSCGGDIDKVVMFFKRRNKEISLMHCVGIYPTPEDKLNLENIRYLDEMHPELTIGYSAHENPKNYNSIQIAVALGARIFERHVDPMSKNLYSSNLFETKRWLSSAEEAFRMLGSVGIAEDEVKNLRELKRAVWAKEPIKKGEKITQDKVYFAIPAIGDALLANNMSKYNVYYATQNIEKDESIREFNTAVVNSRKTIEPYVQKIQEMLKSANIVLKNGAELELSHHYGLDKFWEFGCSIINVINRAYCKKLLVVFPNQVHPLHRHQIKEETFHVLYGDLTLNLDGVITQHSPGDLIPVECGVLHGFSSGHGAIIEEISTTHLKNDSFYDDPFIVTNNDRKTTLSLWTE